MENAVTSDQRDDEDLENNGYLLDSYFIPEEIITLILSFLHPRYLLRCRLVCREWRAIVDDEVWRLKVRNSRNERSYSKLSYLEKVRLKLPWHVHFTVFTRDPFERNLLRNNCGQDKFQYWYASNSRENAKLNHRRELASGGWDIESTPVFTLPLPESEDFGSNKCCFSTSYNLRRKKQLIHLRSNGISDAIMDEMQPTITVSEWYGGRHDCGCVYTLRAYLLGADKRVLVGAEPISRRIAQWQESKWCKVTIKFDNYGSGVRFVVFEHEGQDTQFWAGNYGSKMAGGVVMVSLPSSVDTLPVPISTS